MLKVEYAPPGTDPTRLPTKRNEVGLQAVIQQNGLLLAAIVMFILVGYKMFSKPAPHTPQAPQAQPTQASPVVAAATPATLELPGCFGPLIGYEDVIRAGRRYDPAPWVVAIDPMSGELTVVNCHEDGTWFFLNVAQTEALPDTPQMGAVSGTEEGTSSESGAP